MNKKQEPTICYLQETHFRAKNTYTLKMKEWKKVFHTNGKDRKTGVSISVSDKIDFKTKAINKDKKRTLFNDKRIN